MISFPRATEVRKLLPKNAFYRNLNLSQKLKDSFVSDIENIYVVNSLRNDNLNLNSFSDVKEILVLSLTVRKAEINKKILEAIAQQNPHKLLFILNFDEDQRLAVYYRKLYQSNWMDPNDLQLEIQGTSLDEIWKGIIEQIAIEEKLPERATHLNLDQKLEIQAKILELKELINKKEKAIKKEMQPKKQYEMYKELQKYQKELEDMLNG